MGLETGPEILMIHGQLEAERNQYDDGFQDISDHITGTEEFRGDKQKGRNRHRVIYDSTAEGAGDLLANTLHGLMTNPGAPFVEAQVPAGAREIGENNDYLVHIDDVIDGLYKDERHGFPVAAPEFWNQYVQYGNGAMFTDEEPGIGPVDRSFPISELVFDTARNGMVDTVYRKFNLTARMFIQEYGRGASKRVDEEVVDQPSKEFEVLHVVHPRSDIIRGPLSVGKKMRSVHVLMIDKQIVRDSGFTTDPWQVARWQTRSGEKYGFGPGWKAVSDAKTANEFGRILLISGQKDIEPALLVPSDGVLTQIDTSPNALVVYQAGALASDGIRGFPTGSANPVTIDTIEDRRQQIRDRYFHSLLQLFDGAVPTATQALEMESKAARILISTVSRAAAEFIAPSIRRRFDIASRMGMFDDAPESMEGIPISLRYLNPIIKLQRQMQVRGILNTVAAAGQMLQVDPSVADNINLDKAIRQISAAEGSESIMNSQDVVDAIREFRAKQEAAQAQLDQLSQGAEAVGKALPAIAKANQDRQGLALAA